MILGLKMANEQTNAQPDFRFFSIEIDLNKCKYGRVDPP